MIENLFNDRNKYRSIISKQLMPEILLPGNINYVTTRAKYLLTHLRKCGQNKLKTEV